MRKEDAKKHILKGLKENDELVGFFTAQGPFPIWWFLLLGPLGFLFLKAYFIGVTQNGIGFYRLSIMGKFKDEGDFFQFSEIESVKIKKGFFQRPLIFTLNNGTKIKIKAQIKGLAQVAKMSEKVQQHIENNISVAS